MNAPEDALPAAPASVSPRSRPMSLARACLWTLPFVFFGMLTGLITLVEAPLRLVFGWALHLWVMLPVLLPQWSALLLPLACLAVSLWLGHGLIRWAIAAKGGTPSWKFSQTAAVFALLLSGSAAAIAMSGVVHQLAWLSKEPMVGGRMLTERMAAINSTRHLLDGVHAFRAETGRYPDGLDELESFRPELAAHFWMEVGGGAAPEKVIYLKPSPALAAGEALPPNATLFVSPALRPEGRVVIGRGDRSAIVIWGAKAEEILQKAASHGN